VLIDPEYNPEEIVNPGKSKEEIKKIKTPQKNTPKKKVESDDSEESSVVEGLLFEKVVVLYKDELGKLTKSVLDFQIPKIEKEWYQWAIRKMLWLYFDENAILPRHISSVQIPSITGKPIDISSSFLDKPISELNKKECLYAAIYYKLRTIARPHMVDESGMRSNLWHLYSNKDNGDDIVNWKTYPMDINEKIKSL
jgi:hypothetical protein